MHTKIKSLLLSAFLVMAVGLKAQEAGGYEFAVVQGGKEFIKYTITTNNNEEAIPIPKGGNVYIEIIKKIEELSKQGWIVFNVTTDVRGAYPIYVYHLKRKIK